eukprot:Clim_evm36s151 gene=Clim_evmTU36s151
MSSPPTGEVGPLRPLWTIFGLIGALCFGLPRAIATSAINWVFGIAVTALLWIRLHLLRLLLMYRRWVYAPNSWSARIHLTLARMLGGPQPKLWELQPALPALPVPNLNESLDRYLTSVKPLLRPEEYSMTKERVEEFRVGVGKQLQRALQQRARQSTTSWLLDWWENIVYLGSRTPLPIYSNWYCLDRIEPVVRNQTSRAANMITAILKYKRLVDTEQLEPNRVQGTIPLCMWQFSRIFGTVRIPDDPQDYLVTYSNSRHIVVIYEENYFRLNLWHSDGTQLTNREIRFELEKIKKNVARHRRSNGNSKTYPVAALTSGNRSEWAKMRKSLLSVDKTNHDTLDAIESALFVVVLDDECPEDVEDMQRLAMHREGRALWFDKNFNIVFFGNGRLVMNVDHTWCDPLIMIYMTEFAFSIESGSDFTVDNSIVFDDAGVLSELKWHLTPPIRQSIHRAHKRLMELTRVVQGKVLQFNTFGKNIIKGVRVSPDAFCQAALQLTYYRLHGSLTLTYESAATISFHHGRTETVRSLTPELAAFCQAMEEPGVSDYERLNLLKEASSAHARNMRLATNGEGFDRHLMGLQILAASAGVESPAMFTDTAYNLPFRLSTSQTPAFGTLGGGFSPQDEDGYGCAYIVAEDRLWFHLTAFTRSSETDVDKFHDTLRTILLDMHRIFFADPDLEHILSRHEFKYLRSG